MPQWAHVTISEGWGASVARLGWDGLTVRLRLMAQMTTKTTSSKNRYFILGAPARLPKQIESPRTTKEASLHRCKAP